MSKKEYLPNQTKSNENDIFDYIESLKVEEARLTEQKENLSVLLWTLEGKAKKEVEKRKFTVDMLDLEVADLKLRCEKLSSLINPISELECSQTDP